MATLIPEPINVAPETADWQALLLKDTKTAGGAVGTCRLTNWDTTSEPQVASGSRFEINGSFYEVAPSAESITGWSGISTGAFAYVYATPSGSSAAFSYSSTAPAWDSAKGGWYNGTARALFRLKKTGASAYADKCLLSNGKTAELVDEAATRAAADTQEVIDRNNAVAAAVASEAGTRGTADTNLQNNINSEKTARENADASEANARAAISTALMTLGAVGSLAFLAVAIGAPGMNPGDVHDNADGLLKYAGMRGGLDEAPATMILSAVAPEGKWKCLGFIYPSIYRNATLFVRVE